MGLAGHLFHIAIGGAKPFGAAVPPRAEVMLPLERAWAIHARAGRRAVTHPREQHGTV
ncbi:hypothetical protein [Belnapia moabensis]|uniref:hypothetical protein n=1 Tax=Belnapia moabensis TaxID=365533 RepID=UPI0012EE59B9|nr:hypothetical protein [Belnapia moabensis]